MNNYQSESLTNLIPALIRAQSKLEIAEKTKKMGAGEKSPRWKYANWPTLVEASRKALEKEGLCVSQRLIDVPHGTLLSTLLLHTSGEYLDSRIKLLITPASTSQDVGGNITYFKRYAYAALIGLVTDEEDDDGTATSKSHREYVSQNKPPMIPKEVAPSVISDRELAILEYELDDAPELVNSLLQRLNIKSLKEVPPHMFDGVIKRVREIKRDKAAK